MNRIIFKKATSKQNILNEKLHSEPTKCHSIMLEHNEKMSKYDTLFLCSGKRTYCDKKRII